jgi:general L-amino acid transport system ATP-binding protein
VIVALTVPVAITKDVESIAQLPLEAAKNNSEESEIMISQSEPVVEIEGLNKWFGALHVLKGIDLKVAGGTRIVVCGPSGSGKSTLIRCINGLETYQAGALRLLGTTLGQDAVASASARRKTGMVFQSFNLFPHLNVLGNCTLALRRGTGMNHNAAEEIAMAQLEKVRISEKAKFYPGQLSGGQQQRVAIARALCLNPRIMLFDEPTSALDPEMIKEVLDVMTALARDGMTMICVTHEMGFAREVADQVVFMDDGRILDLAPAGEFFGESGHPRSRQFLEMILKH